MESSLEGCSDAKTASAGVPAGAVELVRLKEKPVVQIAQDLGISDSCLRGWMHQADIDEGSITWSVHRGAG